MTESPGTGVAADVIVVGGGIAGLAAAFELTRRGLRPLVLEATSSVGGAVARHRVAGLDLDAGAESYALARPGVTTLIADLGLTDKVVSPAAFGAWVRHEAGTAPLPPGGWLGIPTRPWSVPVRRALGASGAARAAADRWLPAGWGTHATFGGLVRRRQGARVLRRLVEPVVAGVHAADPDELEVATVAPTLPEHLRRTGSLAAAAAAMRGAAGPSGSAVAGLLGGMYELILALRSAVESAGGQIRTGVPVSAIDAVEDGWAVDGIRTPRVVLGVPGESAARLLSGVLPGIRLDVLAAAGAPIALVTLVLDAPHLDDAPRGTGVLVASRASGVYAKALTHATAKWPWLAAELPRGRHVLRLSYGRPGAPAPADDLLADLALADAARLLGVQLSATAVVDSAITHWSGGLPPGRPGHAAAVAELRAAVATRPGLAVIGSSLAGTGLAAVIADARTVAQPTMPTGRTVDAPGAGWRP
jgi:oxygen-dependent protoporphyrinogen oxidase